MSKLDRETIKSRLQDVFINVFDDDDIELQDGMTAEDLDEWDSLAQIQLVVASEKEFEVQFSTAEITKLKNVGEMIELIEKHLNC